MIIPGAERRPIQTQLEGYTQPTVLTYSLESTVAEKFDAILQRFELTGRMKDFYDIYYLSKTFNFDGTKLQSAIQQTLQNRGTTYENNSFDHVFALADQPEMLTKWRYFLKSLGTSELEFSTVIQGIGAFLLPVWQNIVTEEPMTGIWNAQAASWGTSEE